MKLWFRFYFTDKTRSVNMAIFAGNFNFKIPNQLQSRIFLLSWVKMNITIGCSKGREYGSSVPVRYIPKRPLKSEESENRHLLSSAKKADTDDFSDTISLRIEAAKNGRSVGKSVAQNQNSQFQNQIRNSVFSVSDDDNDSVADMLPDEDRASFEIMEEPSEVVEELIINERIDCYGHDGVQASFKKEAEKLAVELLAIRAYTVAELRKKLLKKNFTPEIVNTVVNDFKCRGLINDGLYAETFSQSRWSNSTWGPKRIKQALYRKGVGEVDAEKAVNLVFQDGRSEDQVSRLGLSKNSMDHLYTQASKQWLRGRDVSKETRKGRIIRWLQYRGFNWGVTSSILKRLEADYPT